MCYICVSDELFKVLAIPGARTNARAKERAIAVKRAVEFIEGAEDDKQCNNVEAILDFLKQEQYALARQL